MVLFALSIIPIMGAVGLAIDGGNVELQKRSAQNAADAAALAGGVDLAEAIGGATVNVGTDVTNYVAQNAGTSSGDVVVTPTWNFIDNADNNLGTTLNLATNTGVRVTVDKTFPSFFARIIGKETFSVRATASAKLQSLAGGGGPFLVCSQGLTQNEQSVQIFNLTPNPPVPNQLIVWKTPGPGPGTPTPPTLIVHYSQLHQGGNCGYGSQFKGPTDPASPSCPSLPCWALGNNGNTSNVIPVTIQGLPSCKSAAELDAGNCAAVLPILAPDDSTADTCTGTPPSAPGARPVCVRAFAVFWMLGPSNPPSNCNSNCHKARMLAGAIVTGGTGGVYTPGQGGPLIVHLSS
jgi:hypothetical protein